MNFYSETTWGVTYNSPNPDCSTQQKVFEKCEKVFPTTLCINVSGLEKCREKPNIDCILRKREFEECLRSFAKAADQPAVKNGYDDTMCDKRTQYLTLCSKAKTQ